MVHELNFGARFYKEHRRDRLDAIALRWGMGEDRQRASEGLRSRAFEWFAERFDGPAFWTISPADPAEMMSPGYSTIVVELVDHSPQALHAPVNRGINGRKESL